ncbi:hypothetical protein J4E91_002535 [Alternaria rosae]|nr:hypothetical protein J4E91_002535 [Alternaria rosae]
MVSDAFVPCSDHNKISKRRLGHEQISLEVGQDSDSEIFDAPLRQLHNTSDYFNDQLDDSSEYFSLPDESPRTFSIYLEFLANGYLHHPDPAKTTDERISFGRLIHLFRFANEFGIISLRNAALDEFFLRIYDDPDDLPYRYIFNIYQVTSSDSSLRHLAVDIIVNIGMKTKVREWMDDLPKEFLMDCLNSASEDGIIPFPEDLSEDEIINWLGEMKKAICELFHVHDPEPDDQKLEPRAGTSVRTGNNRRPRRRAKRRLREAKEAVEDEAQAQNMDLELQKISDEESAARMECVMGPLPIRERH